MMYSQSDENAQARRRLALEAATHAYLYAGAVKFQAESLLAVDPPDTDQWWYHLRSAARQAQALMLVLALRNLLRAAEMAVHYAEGGEADNLQDALARFENALPDLKTARDVLEHFDEYLQGKGRTAKVYDLRFERRPDTYLIWVDDLCIDAAVALREARHLSGNVISIAGSDWGYPVGNETLVLVNPQPAKGSDSND